jgi:hypothetical protein
MSILLAKTMFLQIGKRRYQVASFQQASQMFCAARDATNTRTCYGGASKIKSPHIVDETGSVVGYVAYNGRVFAGEPKAWTSTTALLFDNRVEA